MAKREQYETKEHRSDEQRILKQFRKQSGLHKWRGMKLPKFYQIDYALLDTDPRDKPAGEAKIRAFVEIKRRGMKFGKYATFMLSYHKWLHGRRLAIEANVPFLLVVEFEDGIRACRAERDFILALAWGGRTDREDEQDSEPCVFIPMSHFLKPEAVAAEIMIPT